MHRIVLALDEHHPRQGSGHSTAIELRALWHGDELRISSGSFRMGDSSPSWRASGDGQFGVSTRIRESARREWVRMDSSIDTTARSSGLASTRLRSCDTAETVGTGSRGWGRSVPAECDYPVPSLMNSGSAFDLDNTEMRSRSFSSNLRLLLRESGWQSFASTALTVAPIRTRSIVGGGSSTTNGSPERSARAFRSTETMDSLP